jgi:hypothetical protein
MGRHRLRWLPKSPTQRFLIAFAGIVALAFAALAVVALLFPATS